MDKEGKEKAENRMEGSRPRSLVELPELTQQRTLVNKQNYPTSESPV